MGDVTDMADESVGSIGPLSQTVQRYSDQMLAAYREHPPLVDEHAGLEENISQGGYGRRQIHELIQNGADELIGSPGGKIHVVLTKDYLYCANEGSPITQEGVASILLAHVSPKRGDEIGRFGLGFKSVLGVTQRPEFFSHAVSFGFDLEWAEEQISAIGGPHEAYPILRIARLLDLSDEVDIDPVLAELSQWATTVVRLPIQKGADWLAEDLRSFDSAFLLFSPHVGALVLEDQTADFKRSIQMKLEGSDIVLEEGDKSQRWRVFQTELEPTVEASRDAGKLQHRGKLPIIWAVPVEGRLEIGQFWAFFPLRDQTTLSGIANAPWQVNDDRTGLLENSKLNEELLSALVELVFESLAELVPGDDPGRVLDLTPARGRESRCWGDDVLTTTFNDLRVGHSLIPDQDGVLRRIHQLRVPPVGMPREAQDAWALHPRRPTNWAHPSASSSPARRSALKGLLDEASLVAAEPLLWLEVLLDDDDVGPLDCAEALKIAAVAVRTDGLPDEVLKGIRKAQIVLNDAEEWSLLDPEWIWVDSEESSRKSAVVVVHPDVVAHEGTRQALTDLGILPVTPLLELNALLSEAEMSEDKAWAEIWMIAGEIEDVDEAAAALRAHVKEIGPYSVRAADGAWRPCTDVLLPGRVIEVGASTGQSVVVDSDFHASDLELMRRAGISDGPMDGGDVEDDPRTRAWRKHVLDEYAKALAPARPGRGLLELDRTDVPLPLAVLPRLIGDDCARFVALLLQIPGAFDLRHTRHRSNNQYPVRACDSPAAWAVKKWGLLNTSFADASRPLSVAERSGARMVADCVGPGLDAHREVLPVADLSADLAEKLGLPQRLEDIPQLLWADLLGEAIDRDPEELGSLLALAVDAGVQPIGSVSCVDGTTFDLTEVVVSTSRDDIGSIGELGMSLAVVRASSVVDALCGVWGLRSGNEFFNTEVLPVDAADPIPVLDLFPDLEALDPGLTDLKIVVCDEIVVARTSEEGAVSKTVEQQLDGAVLYVTGDEGEEGVLNALLDVKGWDLTPEEREHTLQSRRSAEGRALRRTVTNAVGLGAKILLAIGRPALLRRLPKQVISEMTKRRGGKLTDGQVAELALAVHGVEVLLVHREDLRSNGLDTPSNWGGGGPARSFVLGLGFPKEYAGFKGGRRDALLYVPGPPEMPPLHPFQREAADQIRDLVRSGQGRGMLSLPTGAGKTRTAVEAIIESMREGELNGPVLWVAQTDELCEQAVSAWSDNWRSVGPRETLKLSRLWSGNEAQDLHDSNQVVVATMAKLEVVMDNPEYEWLSFANAIVVDEAHRAISPAYTRLLKWLGMGRGRERAPLVGLTATPFRGTSKDQTKALVNRFNNHRLDVMGEDPYGQLQDMGVLSRVEHRLLAGADIKLSGTELAQLKKTRLLPASALEKIGENKSRNQTLLDSILGLPEDHTVLLFAASVPHAGLMAGLLSAEGVVSRAISARTDRGARHHYIEQFREGEVRVLTNFGVLTEGFDAPAVRAVYVARPTYSPNIYQQMIGRGLRGPLNGGKDVCLIANVKDNLAEYGENLAFTEFEYLWGGT